MKFFYSKGGENGNANRAEGIKWLDTNETHIKPHTTSIETILF
jgi:hypothetical protein